MIRFFPYKCPKGDCCLFSWPDRSKRKNSLRALREDSVCVNCGINARDTDTVWDKLRMLYLTLVPFNLRPKNLWYKFSCWGWKRYTTIKPRGLSHEWCDRDHLLIHVVFEVLCEFVEKEAKLKTYKKKDWEWQRKHNPGFYKSWKEAYELYNWWLKEYSDDGPPSWNEKKETATEWYERDEAYWKEVRRKTQRVIAISPYFWT